jgi:hypothetical protein
MNVMKISEFVQQINVIRKQTEGKTNLEEFLRALWGEILDHQDDQPTWELFVQLISGAWVGNAPNFNQEWLQFTRDPLDTEFDTGESLSDFEFLRSTILYQIADLRRMADAGYFNRDPNVLYMGAQSPSGASWYNWTPNSFLEAATAGFRDGARGDVELTNATWRYLAVLLHHGQKYE